MSDRLGVWTCYAQGVYFLLTGLWPLVSIESFQWVTGPKSDHLPTGSESDHWLVNTVAVLVIAVALALLTAAWRGEIALEVAVLAAASAVGLLMIDVVYVGRGVIAPVYLVDAGLEVILLACWLGWFWRRAVVQRATHQSASD